MIWLSSAWASMPRAAGEAACRTVLAHANLVALTECREPAGFKVAGALLRPLVPRSASLGVAKPRPGVEQHQRPNHLGMREVKGERHVAAKREPADHRAVDFAQAQEGRHVLDCQRLGVGRGIVGVVALAMAAHIPDDDPVARGEDANLPLPHPAGDAVAMAQQDGWSVPMTF